MQRKRYSWGEIFWPIKCCHFKKQAKTQKKALKNKKKGLKKIRLNETFFVSQCFIKKLIQILSLT